MAQYVGIDIIEIGRIERAMARWGERFLRRVYTGAEISSYGRSAPSLAARFACKEAVVKLLGAGNKGISWLEIETLAQPGGRPFLRLYGRARSEADRLGIGQIAVSLSHSKDYAVASVAGASATDAPHG